MNGDGNRLKASKQKKLPPSTPDILAQADTSWLPFTLVLTSGLEH